MAIRLRQLDAHFLGRYTPSSYYRVDSLNEAQGVSFQCPKCAEGKEYNGEGFIGVHSIICWFASRGVPDNASPGPGRWFPTGSSLDDLTLSPSISLEKSCGWHGYVKNGEAE